VSARQDYLRFHGCAATLGVLEREISRQSTSAILDVSEEGEDPATRQRSHQQSRPAAGGRRLLPESPCPPRPPDRPAPAPAPGQAGPSGARQPRRRCSRPLTKTIARASGRSGNGAAAAPRALPPPAPRPRTETARQGGLSVPPRGRGADVGRGAQLRAAGGARGRLGDAVRPAPKPRASESTVGRVEGGTVGGGGRLPSQRALWP
jgi:hypothetical protein